MSDARHAVHRYLFYVDLAFAIVAIKDADQDSSNSLYTLQTT